MSYEIIIFCLGKNATKSQVNTSDKPCSINDEPGICIFTAECVKRKGLVLGTCRDGFLFGACCSINPNATFQADLMPDKADPQVILNKIDMLIDKLKPTSDKINQSSSNYSSTSRRSTSTSTAQPIAVDEFPVEIKQFFIKQFFCVLKNY